MNLGHIPWVLHVDLDQFIAAVEVLRRPELAGKPAFGVGSGMPLRIAARKVPDAVVLPGDPEAYARRIQDAVLERTRLHCSVGVGDTPWCGQRWPPDLPSRRASSALRPATGWR